MSEDWHYGTFVQYAYCVSVSFRLFWDTAAVDVLRYGLWLLIIGHWCRWVTARVSMVAHFEAFVQMGYSARVYGWLFCETFAGDFFPAFVVAPAVFDHICRESTWRLFSL